MAPRRRGPAAVLRALTTLLAAAVLVSGAAAATSTPSPSPAPAPALRSPPPRQQQQGTSATHPGATPPAKRHHRGVHVPRAAPKPDTTSLGSWWQRLNLGQRVGIALAAVAVAMQVAFAAILAARARQLRRAWERESPARASIGGV